MGLLTDIICYFLFTLLCVYLKNRLRNDNKHFLSSVAEVFALIYSVLTALSIWAYSYSDESQKGTRIDTSAVVHDTIEVEKEIPILSTIIQTVTQEDKKEKKDEKIDGFVTHVTLTVYNPVKSQCDGDPLTMADGTKINLDDLKKGKIKYCAVSKDLEHIFPPNTVIDIEGHGQYIVHDKMNPRFRHHIDILQDVSQPNFKKKNVKVTKIS